MKKIKIASWNVEGRLSNEDPKKRASKTDILKFIKKLDADVLVLPEAHCELSLDNLDAKRSLERLGYHIISVPYNDDIGKRKDVYASRLSLMMLSRLEVKNSKAIYLGNIRNAIEAEMLLPNSKKTIRILGIHLDDRSEENRLKQVRDLVKIINSSDLPTVALGDFNAMHGEDLWPARFLRSRPIRFLARYILPVIAVRACEMARGEALKLLEDTGLQDVDKKHRPTTTPKMRGLEWLPSIRLIQIDHIYKSKQISCQDYIIAPDGGSDHRAIITTISLVKD